MYAINIADVITKKRKGKGVTQEELATYIGVSKASVSKWETGQSYPDITFLPQLATYFNISIDELMNYSPQMTQEDINKLYHSVAKDFAEQSFDEVYASCCLTIKQYYCCFPLVFKMASLLINHHMLAGTKALQDQVMEKAISLCIRIETETNDLQLMKQANTLRATALLFQNRAIEVIDLLGDIEQHVVGDEMTILANAYIATGDIDRAKEILQSEIYQKIIAVIGTAPMLIATNPSKVEVIADRISDVIEVFELKKLHAGVVLPYYFSVAQTYASKQEVEKCLKYLTQYVEVCCSIKEPLRLHGDDFFDSIEEWFKKVNIDVRAPRAYTAIQKDMLNALTTNPVFTIIKEDPRFKLLIKKLEQYVKG